MLQPVSLDLRDACDWWIWPSWCKLRCHTGLQELQSMCVGVCESCNLQLFILDVFGVICILCSLLSFFLLFSKCLVFPFIFFLSFQQTAYGFLIQILTAKFSQFDNRYSLSCVKIAKFKLQRSSSKAEFIAHRRLVHEETLVLVWNSRHLIRTVVKERL